MDITPWFMVGFIALVVIYGAFHRVDCFEAFTLGAQDGLSTCVRVLPYLCAMLIGVGMLRASGFFDFLVQILRPVACVVGLPPEVLPVAVIRPFSGGAAMAVLADTLVAYGPDSEIGRTACIILGCSETVFYTASIYYGSIGIKDWGHTIPACMLHTILGMICAGFLAKL